MDLGKRLALFHSCHHLANRCSSMVLGMSLRGALLALCQSSDVNAFYFHFFFFADFFFFFLAMYDLRAFTAFIFEDLVFFFDLATALLARPPRIVPGMLSPSSGCLRAFLPVGFTGDDAQVAFLVTSTFGQRFLVVHFFAGTRLQLSIRSISLGPRLFGWRRRMVSSVFFLVVTLSFWLCFSWHWLSSLLELSLQRAFLLEPFSLVFL